jgi:hypothetical protein
MRTKIQIERKKAWEAEIVELNENLQSIYNPKWRLEILTKLKEAYISLAEVIEVEILSEKVPTEEWIGFVEYSTSKRLENTFKTQRAAEMWHKKKMDSLLERSGVVSIGYMSKSEWDKETKLPFSKFDNVAKVPAMGTTEFNDMCMNMFGGNPKNKTPLCGVCGGDAGECDGC